MTDHRRNIAMVAATFLLAAATGQFMQNSAPAGGHLPGVPHVVAPEALAGLPTAQPVPALPARGPVAVDLPGETSGPVVATPDLSCAAHLALAPEPGAMLHLGLSAPCNADERVDIRSNGLEFTQATSPEGTLTLDMPAMADPAQVSVHFPSGAEVVARAPVPDLAAVRRVAVIWRGSAGFRLDALEFGAGAGSAGDVSADNPRGPGADGGFLTLLGDAGLPWPAQAQVYTVPRALDAGGRVRVDVAAPVTQASCGRQIAGRMLRADGAAPVQVTLAMPRCRVGIEGQSVALAGLGPVLRIAAR